MITGDRDALQLVTDRTSVLLTHRGISDMAEMTPEAVKEKYGIVPAQVVDMKALMGVGQYPRHSRRGGKDGGEAPRSVRVAGRPVRSCR